MWPLLHSLNQQGLNQEGLSMTFGLCLALGLPLPLPLAAGRPQATGAKPPREQAAARLTPQFLFSSAFSLCRKELPLLLLLFFHISQFLMNVVSLLPLTATSHWIWSYGGSTILDTISQQSRNYQVGNVRCVTSNHLERNAWQIWRFVNSTVTNIGALDRTMCHRVVILRLPPLVFLPLQVYLISSDFLISSRRIEEEEFTPYKSKPEMTTLNASQFITKCAYGKPEYESKILGKAQIVAFPALRIGNSVERLQVKSCSLNPNLKTAGQIASDEKIENVMHMLQGMKIVFVSAEMAPWSKTGGLGDVLGGLPPAMAANGHRCMVVSPRYDQYKDAWDTSVLAEFKVGDKYETVRFFHCYKRGVDRVFVDHPMFLEKVWGKTGSKIYGPIAGTDYEDNQLRFSLLCLAALEAPRILNLSNQNFSGPYGEDVVFVCNDWHTGVLPCYLKSMYQPRGIYANAKVAFCIHNVSYQGRFPFGDFSLLNLPESFKPSFEFDGLDKLLKGKKINWMKAGVMECDQLLTVSPYYAEELCSVSGIGLDPYIMSKQPPIKGIVNGMDINEWNPVLDKFIAINYDAATVNEAKPLNKEALQAEAGLPVDRNIPLIAFIGRLEEQKGSDILTAAIPELMDENIQIVILGSGKEKMQRQLEAIEAMYPNKVQAVTNFSASLAHQMLAGADFMVMPSRFEPCGLIQLQGMRYGTPVVVSSTGGLVDTVAEGKNGFHMGRFSTQYDMIDPADVSKIVTTLKRAIKIIGSDEYKEMIQVGMARDLSWKGPAKEWESALLNLGVQGSKPGIDGEETAPLAKENVAAP